MYTKLTLGLFAVAATLSLSTVVFADNKGNAATESNPQIIADNAAEQKDANAAVVAVTDEVAHDEDEVAVDKKLGDTKEATDDEKEVKSDEALLKALQKDAAPGGDR